MNAQKRLDKYRNSDREYANTLMTAITALGEDEVMKKLEEAEAQGKRLKLTYPIDPKIGPSEPDGVAIV